MRCAHMSLRSPRPRAARNRADKFEAGAARTRISAPWQNAGGALQQDWCSASAGANYGARCRGLAVHGTVCGGGAVVRFANFFAARWQLNGWWLYAALWA